MKRLFSVTAEIRYFIVADDEDSAFLTARREFSRAASDTCDPDVYADEVTELKHVPAEWRDSYPYGKDETERTCEQILKTHV